MVIAAVEAVEGGVKHQPYIETHGEKFSDEGDFSESGIGSDGGVVVVKQGDEGGHLYMGVEGVLFFDVEAGELQVFGGGVWIPESGRGV